MVKALPPGDLTLSNEKDPFASLIPFPILESASVYNVGNPLLNKQLSNDIIISFHRKRKQPYYARN